MKSINDFLIERLKLNKDTKLVSNDLYRKFLSLRKNDKVYLWTTSHYETLTCKDAPKLSDLVGKYYTLNGSNDVFIKGLDSIRCLKEIFDNEEKYILVSLFNSETNQPGGFPLLFFRESDVKEFNRKSNEEQTNICADINEKYGNKYLILNDYLS